METADWLLASVLAHALVAIGVLVYASRVRRESWLSPIVQIVLFLELFTLPLPIRAVQSLVVEGNVTPYLPQIVSSLAPSVWLVTGALLVIVTLYYHPMVPAMAAVLPRVQLRRRAPLYTAAFGICAVSLLLIAILARAAGGILPFVLLGYGVASEMFGKGYLAAGFPWLFVGAMFLLVRYAAYRRRRDLVAFAVALVTITAINVIMGNRHAILYQGITTVVFWHLAVKPVRLIRATPLIVAGFLALNILGYLRTAQYEGVGDVLARGTSSLGDFSEAGDLQSGFYYTLTTGEFVVPFETLPMIVNAPPEKVPLRMGGTFVDAFSFFIPGALWTGRPRPLANWYMETFYGGGFRANEGRAFFFLAEAYLNFGPAGVALLAAIWGIAWGLLGAFIRRTGGEEALMDPVAALIVALIIAFIQRAVAGDFSTLLVGLPQQSLLPVLVVLGAVARVTWGSGGRIPHRSAGAADLQPG